MRIAFVCTANSIRSQLADGIAHDVFPETWNIFSAGLGGASIVHPLVLRVLAEKGFPNDHLYSKSIQEIPYSQLDVLVILNGATSWPATPARVVHRPKGDPTIVNSTEPGAKLQAFRKLRDELIKDLTRLYEELK